MSLRQISTLPAMLMLAASCFASAAKADESPAGIERVPSPPGAQVAFANIAHGDVVPPTFLVQFDVEGMEIAPAGTDVPNSGHHHLLIDLEEIPDPGMPLPMTDQVRHFGKGQTWAELTLPEGEHTLQLVLADGRHVPHDPVVKSERITITVAAAEE